MLPKSPRHAKQTFPSYEEIKAKAEAQPPSKHMMPRIKFVEEVEFMPDPSAKKNYFNKGKYGKNRQFRGEH